MFLSNLAHIFQRTGRFGKAEELYLEALGIARQIGRTTSVCRNLIYLSGLYSSLGKSEQAIAFSEEAISLARDIENPDLERVILGELGNHYTMLGFYEKASNTFKLSIANGKNMETPRV